MRAAGAKAGEGGAGGELATQAVPGGQEGWAAREKSRSVGRSKSKIVCQRQRDGSEQGEGGAGGGQGRVEQGGVESIVFLGLKHQSHSCKSNIVLKDSLICHEPPARAARS